MNRKDVEAIAEINKQTLFQLKERGDHESIAIFKNHIDKQADYFEKERKDYNIYSGINPFDRPQFLKECGIE